MRPVRIELGTLMKEQPPADTQRPEHVCSNDVVVENALVVKFGHGRAGRD